MPEDPLEFLSGLGVPEPSTEKPARARTRRKSASPAIPETKVSKTMTLAQPCCPNGHPVTAAMKFCQECGSAVVVAGPPRCRNGHDVPADARFCASCGVPLQGEAAQQIQTETDLLSKEQAHQRAVAMGKESPVVSYAPGKAPAGVQSVVIHFLVDGFGAFGNVWMRGQEIEVWPGHPRWREAQSWMLLDDAGQYAKYGRQVYGRGPWPGARSYTQGIGQFQALRSLSGDGLVAQPTEEELARADEAERRRGRRVPMPFS
jgi:hypothetical protein